MVSRKNILDAALKIFSEYGYPGTSIKMIAQAADISVGGVYLYFRNKEALYITLIAEMFKELSSQIHSAIEGEHRPSEQLAAYILFRANYARQHEELILTQGKEVFAYAMDPLRSFLVEQIGIIEEIIEKGIRIGEFEPCDAREAAKAVMGILRGFILSLVVDPENVFDPEKCSRLIFRGLMRRSESPDRLPLNDRNEAIL